MIYNSIAPCPAGSFSTTGLAPCEPCPIGTYQGESGSKLCIKCEFDQVTNAIGSLNKDECGEFIYAIKLLALMISLT